MFLQEMIGQSVQQLELLGTMIAAITSRVSVGLLFVGRFVVQDVLHHPTAEPADVLGWVQMGPVYVNAQVVLQFETPAAIIAGELRVHGAVLADVMILQAQGGLVLQFANRTLQERSSFVGLLVLLQGCFGPAPLLTHVTAVSFSVGPANVLQHLSFVFKILLTQRAAILQALVHCFFRGIIGFFLFFVRLLLFGIQKFLFHVCEHFLRYCNWFFLLLFGGLLSFFKILPSLFEVSSKDV